MRTLLAFTIALAVTLGGACAQDKKLTPEQEAYATKIKAIAASLHPQQGDIVVPGADATLHLGENYYFLPQEDAKRILLDAWGNSPEAIEGTLGLVFPKGKSFMDDTWSAVISYEETGYVSDSDANKLDYKDMLKSRQDAEDEINARRKEEQLEPMHLVGWAQPPSYDAARHTMIWAREIQFGTMADHALNYDVRALGRRGVLSMNIVSEMSHLGDVRTAAGGLQNVASFNGGARYADYVAGTDKKAEYGLAGLVAAGLGVAAAKKLGFLALGALFFKKFIVVIGAAFMGAFAWLRNLFRKRSAGAEPPATS